jgi:hypothetical protein
MPGRDSTWKAHAISCQTRQQPAFSGTSGYLLPLPAKCCTFGKQHCSVFFPAIVWCCHLFFSFIKFYFMGKFSKGILGGFSGKVGTVVGGNWKGIDYMRSKSGKRSGGNTPAQLAQQEKFKLGMQFLQPFSGLLGISFRDYAVKMTGINNAMQYLLTNSITGTYPGFSIDYPTVLISRGDLPNGGSPGAVLNAGAIDFTWTDNSGTGKAMATDQALLVCYCADLKQVEWLLNGAKRSDAAGSLSVSQFAGKQVQTWMGFISADGKYIANSVFTGQFTV